MRALEAFRHRNYRLYLFGLVVSQTGTWIQYVAVGLLVYRLTHAPLSLGLVGFLPMVPLVPLMLVAGALADRMPRRKLLVLVQLGSVLPPLGLAVLTWTGVVQVWHVLVSEVVMQALAALDYPARQALVVDTVSQEDLDTAVAAGASAFNLARVVGPALGGLLVAWMGEALCFALNSASFLVAAAALLLLRLPPRNMTARRQSLGANLVEGLRYLQREQLLIAIVGFVVVIGLFIMPYQRFLPVFALDILAVGEIGVGVLNAMVGLGAVLGAIALAWLISAWPGRRGRLVLGVGLLLPPLAASFALSGVFGLSALLVTFIGAGVVIARSLSFTLAQVHVQDELRGRVMGMIVLLSVGAMRVGELGVGFVAEHVGTPLALAVGAGACLMGIVFLGLLMPALRKAH